MSNPFKSDVRLRRCALLSLLFLLFLTPAALGAAALLDDGLFGVPHLTIGWGISALLAALLLTAMCMARYRDHGLLFGCVTILAVLTAVAAFVWAFARRSLEDHAGYAFLIVTVLGVVVLVLTAYDWARRQFMIAATVTAAALSLFIVRVGYESLKAPPQWERDQIAARAIAEEDELNFQYLGIQPGAETSPLALDLAICKISPSSEKCRGIPPDEIAENDPWVVAKHELDVQLAAFRAQVTGSDADKTALKTVLAQQPDIGEDISIQSAAESGPDILWRSIYHSSEPPLIPGLLGWILLGAFLLGLLARLLKINARQLAGPVSVMPDQSADSGDSAGPSAKLVTALRVAVLQNIPEPGAAPGSPSINPVTTLLDAAGGPLAAVKPVVQAVLGVIGQRYGYRVTVDVTSGGAADGALGNGEPADNGTTVVLVRVMSLTSGITYVSHLCASPDDMEAVRTAGLWAAGFILNRSTRIPNWAAWQADTAHAIVTAKDGTGHTLPVLRAALSEAPNSGLLLVLLGHHYELVGQRLDAIECYARAVSAYPRYVVARYRLAGALASMRHRQDWASQDHGKRQDVLRAVRLAVGVLGTHGEDEIGELEKRDLDPGRAHEDLRTLAVMLLRALELDTRWYYRLSGALRRSERDSIWPTLAPFSSHPAARFHSLVKSARQVIEDDRLPAPAHRPEGDLGKVADKARDLSAWWQVSYNAACGYATRAENASGVSGQDPQDIRDVAGMALDFLELTLVRPGVEQLSADWASRDPDLVVLAADPRFRRFIAQLRPGA